VHRYPCFLLLVNTLFAHRLLSFSDTSATLTISCVDDLSARGGNDDNMMDGHDFA